VNGRSAAPTTSRPDHVYPAGAVCTLQAGRPIIGRTTMDTLTLSGENVVTITEEPAADWEVKKPRRAARWIRAAGVLVATAFVTLVVWQKAVQVIGESQRTRCNEHVKQLGVAFQKCIEAQGHLPAPSITGADGKPLLSWRVAILPHLGYQSLYERFHLDEPWDSPHNRALVKEMPGELACPGQVSRESGMTSYVVFVGPKFEMASVNTPFESNRGVDIREVTDGLSNTILVFETKNPVFWTKPEDLEWAPDGPLPQISSPHAGGTHALFIDGSVHFLKLPIEQRTFRAILTVNGGEVVSSS
jgi:prepilin-type processing-associated H-X9-DG protein